MQAIHRAASSKAFLSVLVGTAVVCGLLGWLSLGQLGEARARYRLAACGLYLVGTFLLTVVVHVPRNEGLERVDPGSSAAAAQWRTYLAEWTPWNHVRGGAAGVALLLLLLGR